MVALSETVVRWHYRINRAQSFLANFLLKMLSDCAWRVQMPVLEFPDTMPSKHRLYSTGRCLAGSILIILPLGLCGIPMNRHELIIIGTFSQPIPQKFPNFLNKVLTSIRIIWHWNTNTNTKHPLQGQPKWQLSTNGSLNTHPISFTKSNSLRCVVLYFRTIYFRTVPHTLPQSSYEIRRHWRCFFDPRSWSGACIVWIEIPTALVGWR